MMVSLILGVVLQKGFDGVHPQSAIEILPKFTVLCFMSNRRLEKMKNMNLVTKKANSLIKIYSKSACYISNMAFL